MARSLVEKRPRAIRDLLALRFLDAAEASFEHLAAMPELGVARDYRDPRLSGVRMWPIGRFENYLIFYRPAARGVEIVRVLHAKRDIGAVFNSRTPVEDGMANEPKEARYG